MFLHELNVVLFIAMFKELWRANWTYCTYIMACNFTSRQGEYQNDWIVCRTQKGLLSFFWVLGIAIGSTAQEIVRQRGSVDRA